MALSRGPKIVTSGLVLALDAADRNSYTPPIVVYSVQCYSVYSGGLRSANYTVQYSDDNSTWTTAFTGVMSNNSSCGIITGTGVNTSNLTPHRYWRYVEGAAIAGHHPRVSRIDFITPNGGIYNLVTYTADNCADSGTYIVGTVSKDFGPSTWRDISGNNNNGTLTNNPLYNGTSSGTIVFPGNIDNRVQTSYGPTFTNFTISLWFKDNNSVQFGRLIDKSYTGGFWLGRNGSTANSWGGGILESSPPYGIYLTLTDGQWHFLTSIRSGTSHILYGDGITNTTNNTVSATALDTTTLAIGGWSNGLGSQQFTGNISNVLFYNRALTATEVLQNYNATKSRFGL